MKNTPAPRTPEEIEALKRSWAADPCWDIEATEGFEAHREELQRFSEETQAEWKAERERLVLMRAQKNGVSVEAQEAIDSLGHRAEASQEQATRILIHHLGKHLDHECKAELGDVIALTIEATRATLLKELLVRGIIQPEALK
ncbi:hypothetical protein [Deinococcus misasensis]|uniref:hypothetical protein n=1 Tax=Deinococcus misasensis TaxID=392413 RepID=UPI00055081C6|nr:hypothetical protein [Deinococcus misasensis]